MVKKIEMCALFCSIALGLGGWSPSAAAQGAAQGSEAAFFKGKTVKLIVGYAPGGGYDIYARMIAPYLKDRLNATVVIENQPGAGGMVALDALYTAPPDGLQIMLANGTSASMEQLLGEKGVRYDLAKLGYLGLVSTSPYVWLVGLHSPIKTPMDAVKLDSKISWSATGAIDDLSDGAAITCAALKLNCKIVMGYPSSNEAALAVSKGEMDAVFVSDPSANSYVASGFGRPVATMDQKRSRFFPQVPTVFESMKFDSDQKWWLDLLMNVDNLGRILVVPPGMDAARLAFLQKTVKEALADPALIAQGEKTQRYIDYQDPETTRNMALSVVSSVTAAQKERIKKVVSRSE